ncbi:MAG TPA: OsmC family protein [Acidimicrobiales bacterium]|nr:OsmC family protein [Acidimicrobiales bacterium]
MIAEEVDVPDRKADARWEGSLQEGKGTMRLGGGAWEGPYSFSSRFEDGTGTNPEELIAAAHAGCFSMALSGALGRAGFTPTSVATTATVKLNRTEAGFRIQRIDLATEAVVPGIDEAQFKEIAENAKQTCPVSVALGGVGEIVLDARLSG